MAIRNNDASETGRTVSGKKKGEGSRGEVDYRNVPHLKRGEILGKSNSGIQL